MLWLALVLRQPGDDQGWCGWLVMVYTAGAGTDVHVEMEG